MSALHQGDIPQTAEIPTCPKCGAEPKFHRFTSRRRSFVQIVCSNIKCTNVGRSGPDDREAVKRWTQDVNRGAE